jgi:hypothetical protein
MRIRAPLEGRSNGDCLRVYADKLYEIVTERAATAQAQGDQEVVRRIDTARKHYMIQVPTGKYLRLPLTSEFLGTVHTRAREPRQRLCGRDQAAMVQSPGKLPRPLSDDFYTGTDTADCAIRAVILICLCPKGTIAA